MPIESSWHSCKWSKCQYFLGKFGHFPANGNIANSLKALALLRYNYGPPTVCSVDLLLSQATVAGVYGSELDRTILE